MKGNKIVPSDRALTAAAAMPMYSVLVIDNYAVPDPDAAYLVNGFTTWEAAVEYARRRTWDSVEESREAGGSAADVRRRFLMFGESSSAHGGEGTHYRARDELAYFVNNRASKEHRDWGSLTRKSVK
jgi:hypothetical protein